MDIYLLIWKSIWQQAEIRTWITFSVGGRLGEWCCLQAKKAGCIPGLLPLLDLGLEAKLAYLKVGSGERSLSLVINFWSNNHQYSLGLVALTSGSNVTSSFESYACKVKLPVWAPNHKVIEGLLIAPPPSCSSLTFPFGAYEQSDCVYP